jgi:hypothetical protein
MNRMNETRESESLGPLLVGDYYAGASGPTILLLMRPPNACGWLSELFRSLATGSTSHCTLTAEPEVRITNVHSIEVVRRFEGPRVSLRQGSNGAEKSFVWSGTPEGWTYLADLVQSLCESGSGHHYLTDGKEDDATIELSLGEPDVIEAARSSGLL